MNVLIVLFQLILTGCFIVAYKKINESIKSTNHFVNQTINEWEDTLIGEDTVREIADEIASDYKRELEDSIYDVETGVSDVRSDIGDMEDTYITAEEVDDKFRNLTNLVEKINERLDDNFGPEEEPEEEPEVPKSERIISLLSELEGLEEEEFNQLSELITYNAEAINRGIIKKEPSNYISSEQGVGV